ncbi:hypothetical protein JZ751_003097 [Albula glossodonta]|uniref:Uncharacterized protein n=1 Tax=Albula glossodonta TaxID=121402 RepID=A0A8T2N8T8_9TELE|nr:hypothetical protein JZ751_003097 [Albula glossodonta]
MESESSCCHVIQNSQPQLQREVLWEDKQRAGEASSRQAVRLGSGKLRGQQERDECGHVSHRTQGLQGDNSTLGKGRPAGTRHSCQVKAQEQMLCDCSGTRRL